MRFAVALAVAVLIAVAVAWAGRVSEGRRAIVDADSALERADLPEAIHAARIACEARCPGCAAPDEGFARLERIARDAEARGDDTTAFAAWRAARAALLATAVTTSSSTRRARADAEIARFAHRLDAAAVAAGATPTPAASEDRVRAALAESGMPGAATFALVGLGGLVFLVAGARFAASAKTRRSAADLGFAGLGIAVAALGALLF